MSAEITIQFEEVIATSLITEALALLSEGQEAEIALYSHVSDPTLRLPARYSSSQERAPKVGIFVDRLLDVNIDEQAEYTTRRTGSPEHVSFHWLIARSRKHPGLFAVSEVACLGILAEPVALRGSIMVSPERDITNSNTSDFSYFLEKVITEK